MNIVVCVKYVPDATADRSFESDDTVDRVGVDGLLSELDEYAVEQALQIKEKDSGDAGTEVTVLTVGPEQASDAIRKSLQMGADKGVHVVDDAVAGSDAPATSLVLAKAVEKLGDDTEVTVLSVGPEQATDAIRKALQMGADKGVHVVDDAVAGSDAPATSKVLAAAIQKLGENGQSVDVVVCGMASTDGGMGVVPAMLAERLGMPQLTLGSEVEVDGTTVRIRRDNDAATQTVEGAVPLVLSVTDQSGEARYPSFKGIMAAKKKPVETWSLADLGVSPDQVGLGAAWSRVEAVAERRPRSQGEVVTDEDGSGAKALADFLASKKFI
jgi:electron transfer flavoprotein beta subunit